MAGLKYRSSRMLIMLIAMAVLLPLLAGLQYYWLGQVSEAASERLESSLRAAANGFRHDFNRELIRAYINFHIDSFSPPDNIESYHLEQLDRWSRTALYPRLISDIFLVNYDAQGQPALRHLDAGTRRFEPAEWSGENLKLRSRFVSGDPSSPPPLDSLDEDIPALIVPFPPPPVDKTQAPHSPPLPQGFTIVKLDLNYMTGELIPSLIERHLQNSNHEYNIAIISPGQPGKRIYLSGAPATDFASSDVSTSIFGLEGDEVRSLLGSQSANAEQTGSRKLINLRVLRRPVANARTTFADEEGRWQLLIKHHSGSLAAAVNKTRRRNLAISFGILLLLGAGILMTAVSTRRAERLARQQIDFVAGVTHELRTPLAVICSAGENLAHGIVDNPQKVAQYGEVIHQEGRRLTDMVEQVLEFAGAQSGRRRYDFRPTNVAEFVEAGVAGCQNQITAQGFRVETQIDSNLPPVDGDALALTRTIQNLLSNAIKYDGNNRWARISAHQSDDQDQIVITIEDHGAGIDSADLPHIFEPFYRGREAIASQIEGSGVGLSLVKQIVEAHRGNISVRSEPGSGSTFTLHLRKAVQCNNSEQDKKA